MFLHRSFFFSLYDRDKCEALVKLKNGQIEVEPSTSDSFE